MKTWEQSAEEAWAKPLRELEAEERKEWNAEAELDRCSWCGEERPCQPRVDPFVQEGISEGSDNPEPWCFDCFEQRAGDV